MADDRDPADELDDHLNLTMMHTQRVIETMARRAEQQRRDREADLTDQTRQTRDDLNQQRDAARMRYTQVTNPTWWEKTPEEEVGRTIETATAWRDLDTKANVACERIDVELKARYGLTLRDFEERIEQERAQRDQEQAMQDRDEERATDRGRDGDEHQADADQQRDPEARAQRESAAAEAHRDEAQAWDSSEARDARADHFHATFEHEAAEAATTADRAQAHPPQDAPKAGRSKGKTKGTAAAQSRSRVRGVNSHELGR